MNDAMLTKIRALLAKAESTDFAEEAASLTAKAVELMAKYQINDAQVRAGTHEQVIVTSKRLDVHGPYVLQKMILLNGIALENRCEAVRIGEKVLHVFGRSDDIEFVEMLFASLLVQQATELLRTPIPPYEHGKTFRTAFMQAYSRTVRQRLQAANKRTHEETAIDTSTALVLVNDKKAVTQAVRADYPTVLASTNKSAQSSAGRTAGTAAGNRADIGSKKIGNYAKGLPAGNQ